MQNIQCGILHYLFDNDSDPHIVPQLKITFLPVTIFDIIKFEKSNLLAKLFISYMPFIINQKYNH